MTGSGIGRRGLLLGAAGGAALLGGCDNLRAPDPPPEPDRLLGVNEAPALAGDQGIACGIGFAAWMNERANLRRDSNGEDRPYRFVFARLGGPPDAFPIQLTRAFTRGLQEDDGLVATESTPFAFRLPAGTYVVALFQVYGLAFIPGPGQREVYRWSRAPVSPLAFEVRPRQIAYVGRIGFFQGVIPFASRAESEAACRPPDRILPSLSNAAPCGFQRLAFVSQPEQDLPLIRARFPTLATERIETSPARPLRGGWEDWPTMRRDPLSTPGVPRMV
jgi:hypothetical protein